MKSWSLILLLLVTAACADRRSKMRVADSYSPVPAEEPAFHSVSKDKFDIDLFPDTDRQLIKDGDLSLKVKDLEKARASIMKLCKGMNAYVSAENLNNYDDRIAYHQTIRVPAANFDSLIAQLEQLAAIVESKQMQVRDVTEEFIDVSSRLKTQKDIENRYRDILRQAHTVEEILAVEKELGNIRQEVESMEGRLQYLRNQVSLGTLQLSYYQTKGTEFGFFSRLYASLASGWSNLLRFVIGLTSIWPFLLMAAVGVWLLRRQWSARKKNPGDSAKQP